MTDSDVVVFGATSFVGRAESAAGGAGTGQDRSQRYEDLALFSSILELVRNHYVEDVDDHALLLSAMRGLLEDLDPHSAFMEPTEFDEMQVETKGEFHGLGIEISKATGEYIEFYNGIYQTDDDNEIMQLEWSAGRQSNTGGPMGKTIGGNPNVYRVSGQIVLRCPHKGCNFAATSQSDIDGHYRASH